MTLPKGRPPEPGYSCILPGLWGRPSDVRTLLRVCTFFVSGSLFPLFHALLDMMRIPIGTFKQARTIDSYLGIQTLETNLSLSLDHFTYESTVSCLFLFGGSTLMQRCALAPSAFKKSSGILKTLSYPGRRPAEAS